MEANELMIGDWVKVIDHFEPWMESLYVRVECLNATPHPFIETEYQIKGGKGCALIRFQPEHIEPIPLTSEILDANGFVVAGQHAWMYNYNEKIYCMNLQPCLGEFSIDATKYDEDKIRVDLSVDNPINSVHKLQHILRLCGLNELADNFKIG